MTESGDKAVDHAADKLDRAADEAAARSAVPGAAAEELRGDAAFLRQLKPSLVLARIRGEAPTDAPAGRASAPSGPQLGRPVNGGDDGPNPFVIVGGALLLGIVLARLIDWRSHAHPRR